MKKAVSGIAGHVEAILKEMRTIGAYKDLMKDRSELILVLVRGLERKITEMERRQKSMDRRQRYIQLKLDGSIERFYPWDRLASPRRGQVIAVRDAMRSNPTLNIPKAAELTFKLIYGGYPSVDALKAYCYSIGLENFLAD